MWRPRRPPWSIFVNIYSLFEMQMFKSKHVPCTMQEINKSEHQKTLHMRISTSQKRDDHAFQAKFTLPFRDP